MRKKHKINDSLQRALNKIEKIPSKYCKLQVRSWRLNKQKIEQNFNAKMQACNTIKKLSFGLNTQTYKIL